MRLLTTVILILLTLLGPLNAAQWSFVVIPDMQQKPRDIPVDWDIMVQWIIDNRTTYNIQAVLAVGDIVNDPAETDWCFGYTGTRNQWDCAMRGDDTTMGWNRLMSEGFINATVPGNHDTNTDFRTATAFNTRFGPSRYTGKSWYVGNYESGNGANFYINFNVGNRKFMVIGLEFFPRPAVVTWAAGLAAANPDRHIIMMTHAYMNAAGARFLDNSTFGPNTYSMSATTTTSNGQQMWDNLGKLTSNMLMMLGGHDTAGTTAHASTAGVNGNLVHEVFTGHGGDNTFMELMQFDDVAGTIVVTNFNAPTFGSPTSTTPYTLTYVPLAGTPCLFPLPMPVLSAVSSCQ